MDKPMNELLEELLRQEEELQFSRFSNQSALEIGLMLVEEAKRQAKAVTIAIYRSGQCLFYHAMEGTTLDNEQWIRRKNNVVNRFGHSSFYIGTRLKSQGKTIEETYAVPSADYAAHGGAFPLLIQHVGAVGTITVSGLPQKEDHDMVVTVLRAYLNRSTNG
jgi:uncharacterized protein (UPF0303 family)